MILDSCRVIALEGSPGSGKTTTALAFAGYLRANSYVAEYCEESARRNPFVEDFTMNRTPLHLDIELHLFAKTIADQVMAARTTDWLVCDKTPASLLAYAEVLMGATLSSADRILLDSMTQLFQRWASSYDLVFLLSDSYDEHARLDPIRAKVLSEAASVHVELGALLGRCETRVIEVPTGLELEERIKWMGASLMKYESTLLPSNGG